MVLDPSQRDQRLVPPPAASSEYAVSSCSARASSSVFLVVPVPVQRHQRGVRASSDCMHGGRLQPLLIGQPERRSQHVITVVMLAAAARAAVDRRTLAGVIVLAIGLVAAKRLATVGGTPGLDWYRARGRDESRSSASPRVGALGSQAHRVRQAAWGIPARSNPGTAASPRGICKSAWSASSPSGLLPSGLGWSGPGSARWMPPHGALRMAAWT